MSKLDFIKKLYNGKNCYSDHMNKDELDFLHISSGVEPLVSDMLDKHKLVFLTGNPGDGKTFIIKAIEPCIIRNNAFVKTDFNEVTNYADAARNIVDLYVEKKPAVFAINEYPFLRLCKEIKRINPDIYNEIMRAKKSAITYEISEPIRHIAVVDLNERNLLTKDNQLLDTLLTKMTDLLSSEPVHSQALKYNLRALQSTEIKRQIVSLLELASSDCEHFAVRDVLGAISFMLTACTMDEYEGQYYYSAIFEGSNELLRAIQKFDPIYLSVPSLDESLWNGVINEGWLMGTPRKWPNDSSFEDDVDAAVECFKEIKRKYYFENLDGQGLLKLQPEEIRKSMEIFTAFDSQKKKIKERLVRSINKLFLPSSDDKKQLHIWTTHRYDLSQEAAVAISSKSVDSSELEIKMPRPADWLQGMEYMPNHIILKPKDGDVPVLTLDADFLRTLDAVENGYPVGLLAPQYEQAAAMFLQQLDNYGYAEENDDGEIILASRINSSKKTVLIQDGKYDFEEGEE